MLLALVRRNTAGIAVALLLGFAVLSWGQPAPSQRVFRVPYTALNEVQESSVYIAAPFVRIGEPWSVFSGRSARSPEEASLLELLTALYRGDTATAESRINPPKEAASGKAFADYVSAFRASLGQAGELEVEGYFPLRGRARFVLRPVAPKAPYRLFTMRAGADGKLRFDETVAPNKVDSALNSVFRILKDTKLEVPALPADGFVTVTAEPGVRVSVKARRIDADLEQMDARTAGPALQFYKTCLNVPDKQSLERYFRCFAADVQSRLRTEYAKMTAEKQDQLYAMTSASRHVEFVIDNGSSFIIFYRSNAYAVSGRDWIQRTSAGDFVLLNPMASFPLDDLLSNPETRAAIATAIGFRKRTSGAGSH